MLKQMASKTHLLIITSAFATAFSAGSLASQIKEYKIVSAHKYTDRSVIETELNQLAAEGWIVKAVVPRLLNGTNSFSDIYLERAKVNAPSAEE